MKVVLDCNVLISAGLNTGTCRDVFAAIIHSHQCILSKDILGEYVSVARRKHFAKAAANLLDLIRLVSQNALLILVAKSFFGGLARRSGACWAGFRIRPIALVR